MGRITDYYAWNWCDICEQIYLPEHYNHDARMCIECAKVTEEEEDG